MKYDKSSITISWAFNRAVIFAFKNFTSETQVIRYLLNIHVLMQFRLYDL